MKARRNLWKRLQRAIDSVILEISAVRLALNGSTTAKVGCRLGLKKQQVAAFLAFNTMWQPDYASLELIVSTAIPRTRPLEPPPF